jgi:hypothetical protein
MDTTTTIVGYVLFAISEVLPFINFPTNGLLHTVMLGFTNAFSNPTKDIELAESLVTKNPNFANIINMISMNPQIKTLVEAVIKDPLLVNILHSIQGDPVFTIQLNNLVSSPKLQSVLNTLTKNKEFCNNVSVFSENPELVNSIMLAMQNKQLVTLLNNPNTLSCLINISQNTVLMNILPYINSEITNNIRGLIESPELSGSLRVMNSLSFVQKNEILNIMKVLTSNPDAAFISNINGLVSSAK